MVFRALDESRHDPFVYVHSVSRLISHALLVHLPSCAIKHLGILHMTATNSGRTLPIFDADPSRLKVKAWRPEAGIRASQCTPICSVMRWGHTYD